MYEKESTIQLVQKRHTNQQNEPECQKTEVSTHGNSVYLCQSWDSESLGKIKHRDIPV